MQKTRVNCLARSATAVTTVATAWGLGQSAAAEDFTLEITPEVDVTNSWVTYNLGATSVVGALNIGPIDAGATITAPISPTEQAEPETRQYMFFAVYDDDGQPGIALSYDESTAASFISNAETYESIYEDLISLSVQFSFINDVTKSALITDASETEFGSRLDGFVPLGETALFELSRNEFISTRASDTTENGTIVSFSTAAFAGTIVVPEPTTSAIAACLVIGGLILRRPVGAGEPQGPSRDSPTCVSPAMS